MSEKKTVNQIATVGIVGNVLLVAFKLYAGIAGKSSAMVSDAIHSLSDVLATFIAFIGVKLAKKRPDKKHPYGHDRFECVASIVLGLILLVTGFGIGWGGVQKIITGEYRTLEMPGLIALVAAFVSIITKEAMFQYTRHYAKKLNSPAFMADAWHHRSDALSSVGSLIGIGGARLGMAILEPIASVAICLCIIKVGIEVLYDAMDRMLDVSCSDDYEKNLANFISEQEGVIKLDMLHTRKFGSKVYIDAEISVDGTLSLFDAHKIAEEVHNAVETNYPEIKHIMIHENPS